MQIEVGSMHFQNLNKIIHTSADTEIELENCCGQRYIGSGISGKNISITGGPGNALGAYFNGGTIEVFGNAQDAVGDTMNEGELIIHGRAGDATGYGMRGGKIFIEGDAGYRCGIHMKAYEEHQPLIIIGGCAGSFLGEYQAGGTIIVLGLDNDREVPMGALCATGMHGGRIFLRCAAEPAGIDKKIIVNKATEEDLASIDGYLDEFCFHFDVDKNTIFTRDFYVLTPDTKNPYKALYTYNP